jgi:hypothetical protein
MLKGPVEPIEDIFVQLSDNPTNPGQKVVTVAWAPNEKATIYTVMRKDNITDKWEPMQSFLSTDLLVFTDYSIEQGVTYTYTIHTYAPDRPSVDNMVGKTIIWPSDNPPAEDTTVPDSTTPEDTTGNGSDETTTTPDSTEPGTTEPETTVPETTEPTTKPEETTNDSGLDIPDA